MSTLTHSTNTHSKSCHSDLSIELPIIHVHAQIILIYRYIREVLEDIIDRICKLSKRNAVCCVKVFFVWMDRHVWMYICMYVCVFVCMHVCMYICMYACMYVCLHTCMYICTYVCMPACMHPYMYVCMYVCMYVSMYVCVCTVLGHIWFAVGFLQQAGHFPLCWLLSPVDQIMYWFRTLLYQLTPHGDAISISTIVIIDYDNCIIYTYAWR